MGVAKEKKVAQILKDKGLASREINSTGKTKPVKVNASAFD